MRVAFNFHECNRLEQNSFNNIVARTITLFSFVRMKLISIVELRCLKKISIY